MRGAHPCRINGDEPQPPAGIPDPPEFLKGEALFLWEELAPQLAQVGVLTVLDRHALAMLCESYGQVRAFPSDRGARNEFRRMLCEFGLTPSSRSQIKVDTRPADDLTQFLSRRKG